MKKSWQFIIGLLAISYWLLGAPAYALPEAKSTFPRLANYFLHWTISEQEARELAKFDLVILDAEVQERSREELKLLRHLNPHAILLAYVPASEIRRDVNNLKEIAPLRHKLGASVPEEWYIHNAQGQRMFFWQGTWIVDVTDGASPSPNPSHQGRGTSFNFLPLDGGGQEGVTRWNEYLPQFVAREILSNDIWDGVFYDNAWDDIVHFARGVPDIDRDGVEDNVKEARAKWQDGVRQIYRSTHELAPNKLVFENDGPMYAPEVHGVLLESFPRKGWQKHREELRRVLREARDPKMAILNANTFNTGTREDWQAMRYGLTTAMLHDAFYSFDFGDQDHGQTWWYDEYEVFLGEAVSPARRGLATSARGQATGPWRRDFENGIVLVNPSDVPATLTLPIQVEKIRGLQDRTVNDGAVTDTFTVLAQDGLIVLRPLHTIAGAPFENGIFARVFDLDGRQTRAGFFAFDRSKPQGSMVARVDLDGDGEQDRTKLSFVQRTVQSLAFGDLTGDGVKEIVIGEKGQVRVYRANGQLMTASFFPFGPRYRGALSMGVGDLNGDGFGEIVVGPDGAGGPQVRIFSGSGKFLSGGFFAYDPRFRGGVRVAVGDIDHDGRAEIVTGPGIGGGPQVRVFSAKGGGQGFVERGNFFAYDRALRTGVIPLVADVDGDGNNEILALTKEIL